VREEILICFISSQWHYEMSIFCTPKQEEITVAGPNDGNYEYQRKLPSKHNIPKVRCPGETPETF
jgi:hypothetical protein